MRMTRTGCSLRPFFVAARKYPVSGCMAVADYQRFDLAEQKEFARKLYMERLSIRQIARMTGMSKSTVARAVKTGEDELPETEGLSLRESEENAYGLYADTIW